MDTRQAEVQAAQSNPNIMSTLVGGQPQTTMSPQPQGGLPQELMGPAQDISSRLYGSGFVGGAEGGRDAALKAMFDADQNLDKQYSALPTPEWYVQNPADTMKATSGYVSNLGQVAGASQAAASDAERAYQAAITGVMDRLVSFMQMQEDRKTREEDRAFEREKFEWQKSQAGGSGTGRSIMEILGGSPKVSSGELEPTYTPGGYQTPGGTEGAISEGGGWKFSGGKWGQVGEPEAEINRNQILQALLTTTNPKEQANLKMILDLMPETTEPDLAATEQTRKSSSESGLRAIKELESMLIDDPSILLKRVTPGDLFTRSYENAAFRAAENILRLRSGAAVPEEEVRRYVSQYLPRLGDSRKDVSNKIASLYNEYIDILSNLPAGTKIRVVEKASGRTGSIPANEFDPNIYEIEGI